MPQDRAGGGVFVNYRRDDTGWAANVTADALRRRLGSVVEVFIDNRSIGLGESFAQVLEDGLRRSAVLVVLIGPGWDAPPLIDRLLEPDDWVRREIVVARARAVRIIPVLVDRAALPQAATLPGDLDFLPTLQAASLRQAHGRDVDELVDRIVDVLAADATPAPAATEEGAARTPAALGPFLKSTLPPAQQWMGNRDRLVNLAMAVLSRDDRLVFLAPIRINDGPKGSAAVFVTGTDVVVVEVDETLAISAEIRFPRERVRRVEVVPTIPLFADVLLHTTAGDRVRLQGLFRDQAQQLGARLN